jgi:RNA polymerase sigma-70 factor (ECF subfamily)
MRAGASLSELYSTFYRPLVVQLFALCGELAEAEDAVQEAFVVAVRRQGELAGVVDPEAWLRAVAKNRLRSRWRHLAVVRRYQAAVPGPQTPPEVTAEHVALMTALSRLDPAQREVVVLHHLADLSVAEIAEQLGIRVGTVKSRLARARARLAVLLDESEEAPHA